MKTIDERIEKYKKGLEIFKDEKDISDKIKNVINNLEEERSNFINHNTFRIDTNPYMNTNTVGLIAKYFTKTIIEYKDFVLINHDKQSHGLEFEISDPAKYLAIVKLFSEKTYIFDLYPIYNVNNNNTFEYSRIFRSCRITRIGYNNTDSEDDDLKCYVYICYNNSDILDHKEKISREELI